LLDYFRHNGYKLLERNTGAVFRSCDVIFEEGIIHYAKQSTLISFTDENNPFSYKSNS